MGGTQVKLRTAALIGALALLALPAGAAAADGTFERTWGKDVLQTGGTDFEVCTAAASCKVGAIGGLGGELNGPFGVATDSSGNVYVLDTFNNRVQKFDSSGTFERAWGKGVDSAQAGTGFEVCTVAANCQAGTAGSLGGELSGPIGIAADSAGNVYVSDSNNRRIQKFDSTGTFLMAYGKDVVTGGATDFENCTVAANCKQGEIGVLGGEFGTFGPRGIATDAANNVYVADVNSERIQKFTSSGSFTRTWGKDVDQAAGTGFENCTVAANCKVGVAGPLGGEFNGPVGIATDANSNVYVADNSNFRVQKFDSNGTFERAWGKNVFDGGGTDYEVCTSAGNCQAGQFGSLGGEMNQPTGLAVDSNLDVYVADLINQRVQRFDSSGTWERAWGKDVVTGGTTDFEICTVAANCKIGIASGLGGEFASPFGVAAGPSDVLYVADRDNNRIQKFAAPPPDGDADGVPDATDNCPADPNANQANNDGDGLGDVCDPDDDNDGLNDGVDNCPVNANPAQTDTDGDLLGDACDPDDDNDGVADGSDACPTGASAGTDTDGDGCKDAGEDTDDDSDGVLDGSDNCATVANASQQDSDGDGVGDVCDATALPPDPGPGADTTAPDTTITAGPSGKTKSKTATIEFSGTDSRAVAGFQCKLDGDSFEPCGSPKTYTGLKKGSHTVEVRAVDGAGNVDPSPATSSWTVKKKKRKK